MKFRLLILSVVSTVGWADEFPVLPNTESSTDADPPSAEESATAFSLPDGVKVKLWASEPKVQNPIAMAWDSQGRMWIAENYTYASRKIRFDLSLKDRVIVLSDEDGDGRAEIRKVFTDEVQMLTSVEVGHGGVWLMCPPQLLFIPDQDGDLVPDGEPEVMLDGFDVARGNYHNFANGLRWGPDGWLYGRCGHSCPGKIGVPGTPEDLRYPIDGGIWRYHPKRKVVEVLAHGTVNPWGHDWDEHGELFFINTVIGHMWHMISGAHYRESGSGASQNPLIYERMHQHADHFHYDTNLPWGRSRYGAANDFGGGHAHVGMAIYQAEHFPSEWKNRLLTWNQHGKRLNRERLKRKGSGYTGVHESDAFLHPSEWFRGMEVSVGPDGAIYGLDWSDTGECHDHTGVHRTSGRIYKFYYQNNPVADLTVVENAEADPEAIIRHANAWFSRQWIRALAEGEQFHSKKAIQISREILADTQEKPAIRLRAMWGLYAMGLLNPEDFIEDSNEHICTWAIRLLIDSQPMDTLFGPREKAWPMSNPKLEKKFTALAKRNDSSLVRLALASSLQRLPVSSRLDLAKALVTHSEDGADHNIPMIVWAGILPLVEQDPGGLIEVARATTWPSLRTWIARAMTERSEEQPEIFDALLNLLIEQPTEVDSLLAGMERAVLGIDQCKKPKKWNRVRNKLSKNPTVLKLSVIFGDPEATQEMEKVVLDPQINSVDRRRTLKVLIESDFPKLKSLCEILLADPEMQGIAARGLSRFKDLEVGKKLRDQLNKFSGEEQNEVVEILCGRPSWADALLDKIGQGQISKSVLSPYHASQIQALADLELNQKLAEVWGVIRSTPAGLSKRKEELKEELNTSHLANANLSEGRNLYQQQCSNCHVLYGEGGKLGPDLTGSGRNNLDYLLENIVDPNSVVSADYRMNVIELLDGRVLSGMIAEQDRNSLTLRMPGSETVLRKSEIKKRQTLENSIMPAGLLDHLEPDQRRNLVAYLMHPFQVK